MSSKRFFSFVIAGFLTVSLLYFAAFYFQLGTPTPPSHWSSEAFRKKLEAATNRVAPALVLIGGSSTHFGISARRLQEKTGLPSFNLGIHAGLGLDYILRKSKSVLRPHDIALLAVEYELYLTPAILQDEVFTDYILARDPAYFRSLPLTSQLEIGLRTSLNRLRRGVKYRFKSPKKPAPDRIYSTELINNHGDQTGHTAELQIEDKRKITNFVSSFAFTIDNNAPGFRFLSDFILWAKSNNINVAATFPALYKKEEYSNPSARENSQILAAFYARAGVPLFGSPEELMFPLENFLDTPYHLHEAAALRRTDTLAAQIQHWLQTSSPPRPN